MQKDQTNAKKCMFTLKKATWSLFYRIFQPVLQQQDKKKRIQSAYPPGDTSAVFPTHTLHWVGCPGKLTAAKVYWYIFIFLFIRENNTICNHLQCLVDHLPLL